MCSSDLDNVITELNLSLRKCDEEMELLKKCGQECASKDELLEEYKKQVSFLKMDYQKERERVNTLLKENAKLREDNLLEKVSSEKLIFAHGHDKNKLKNVLQRLEASTNLEVTLHFSLPCKTCLLAKLNSRSHFKMLLPGLLMVLFKIIDLCLFFSSKSSKTKMSEILTKIGRAHV